MPCRDYYDDNPQAYYGPQLADKDAEIKKLKKQISFAESALCAVLRAGENNVGERIGNILDLVDFPAAGIKQKELEKWFENHKVLDEKIKKEKAEKMKKARAAMIERERLNKERNAALAKLTPAERKMLGVK